MHALIVLSALCIKEMPIHKMLFQLFIVMRQQCSIKEGDTKTMKAELIVSKK